MMANVRNLDAFITDSVHRSEAYLEHMSKTFPDVVGWTVRKGKPEDVVIEKAADGRNTLIAMATHGRSGIDRWLLGSVVEKVLRGTTNSLLLVRATEHGKSEGESAIKRVIVPLDGSPLAEKVLPYITGLAKELAFETVLLRAYNLSQVISIFEGTIPDWEKLEAKAKMDALGYLDSKVRELKHQGLIEIVSRASDREAAREIIEAAAEPDSLIAMCTHGRSGVKRWVLGSVTEKVVRHSDRPVLVIPAKALQEEKPADPIDEMRNALKYSLD
jgi:nucleotide-binding universal stress UspA family protein